MSETLTIGGSSIVPGKRYNGAPSITYPMLRDLADESQHSRIIIEIDTAKDRYVGYIDRLLPASSNRKDYVPWLVVANDVQSALSTPENPRTRKVKYEVSFGDILAFRVLKVGWSCIGAQGLEQLRQHLDTKEKS